MAPSTAALRHIPDALEAFPVELASLSREIGIPLADWPGACHAIATAVLRHTPIPGIRLARGHWIGPVSRRSIYGASPCQHSWLVLEDGRILDPTRWALLGKTPSEIYCGPCDHYDEAGRTLRASLGPSMSAAPSPGLVAAAARMTAQDRQIILQETYQPQKAETLIGAPDGGAGAVAAMLHDLCQRDPAQMTRPQAVYTAIERAGLKAFVPIDLWQRIMDPAALRPPLGVNRWFSAPPGETIGDAAALVALLEHFVAPAVLDDPEGFVFPESQIPGSTFLEALWNTGRRASRIPGLSLDGLGRDTLSILDSVADEALGSGFGMALQIERYAASIGRDRQALDALLKRLADLCGRIGGWA